jgi:hypothetical protein
MEGHCRDLWQREYSHLASKEDDTKPKGVFEVWRNRIRNQDQPGDEFSLYCPRGAGIATIIEPYFLVGHLRAAIP